MDPENQPERALHQAIERMLRPLFRLLLRHAVSFGAFEDIAKRAYVDVAFKDFSLPGKKTSISRVAVLSGLTRKEVQQLREPVKDNARDVSDRYNRAVRVLTGWTRDERFCGPDGTPRVLEADGELGFAGLVRRHSGDMPARAVLDELIRVGSVRRLDDGRIELVTRAYVPQNSPVDKIGILGSDVADLIATIDHNLQHGGNDPRFQRKVMYDAIPQSTLPEFRILGAQYAQALLEMLDRWLAERDIEAQPGSESVPQARVGLGIYYFEERLEVKAGEGNGT